MLSRPLIYTALTRAQRHLSIVPAVGPGLRRAVRDVGATPRRTRLVDALRDHVDRGPGDCTERGRRVIGVAVAGACCPTSTGCCPRWTRCWPNRGCRPPTSSSSPATSPPARNRARYSICCSGWAGGWCSCVATPTGNWSSWSRRRSGGLTAWTRVAPGRRSSYADAPTWSRSCVVSPAPGHGRSSTGFGPVLFCHGTPRAGRRGRARRLPPAAVERSVRRRADDVRTVVCGHTHMPFVRLADRRLVDQPRQCGDAVRRCRCALGRPERQRGDAAHHGLRRRTRRGPRSVRPAATRTSTRSPTST